MSLRSLEPGREWKPGREENDWREVCGRVGAPVTRRQQCAIIRKGS